jgi:hypothetical protein
MCSSRYSASPAAAASPGAIDRARSRAVSMSGTLARMTEWIVKRYSG